MAHPFWWRGRPKSLACHSAPLWPWAGCRGLGTLRLSNRHRMSRHAEWNLAELLPGRLRGGPLAVAGRRESRGLRPPGGGAVRHGPAQRGYRAGAGRHHDPLAGLPGHRREGRDDPADGLAARPALSPPDARGAQRPSGHGADQHELRRQYPGAGQRRHAHRHQGDALPAGAQPQQRARQQRPDPLPGAQYLLADPAAGDHLHVPRPAAGRGAHVGVPADPAGHYRLQPGGASQRGADAANSPLAAGGAGLPGRDGTGPGAAAGGAGGDVGPGPGGHLDPGGQPGAVRHRGALPGGGGPASVNVYEAFIEGAKEGVRFSVTLLPYLIAMLVAVGVLRASGVLDAGLEGVRWVAAGLGWDTRFVEALPTAFIKPLSGSGARAMMIETMDTFGVDSFPALLAATLQGSTETTFYVLAVYFGAVGIRRIRHGLGCALVADLAGILTAIAVCYWFFG